jgi:hypothetical protein
MQQAGLGREQKAGLGLGLAAALMLGTLKDRACNITPSQQVAIVHSNPSASDSRAARAPNRPLALAKEESWLFAANNQCPEPNSKATPDAKQAAQGLETAQVFKWRYVEGMFSETDLQQVAVCYRGATKHQVIQARLEPTQETATAGMSQQTVSADCCQ